jgi:hypothetical protein
MDALRNLKKITLLTLIVLFFFAFFNLILEAPPILYFYVVGDNTPRKAHLRPANQVLAIFNPLKLS